MAPATTNKDNHRKGNSVNRDSLCVAAAAVLIHLRDKWAWKILPDGCMKEISASFGAQLAAAVSGKIHRVPDYYQRLCPVLTTVNDANLLILIYWAIAMGFDEKWINI